MTRAQDFRDAVRTGVRAGGGAVVVHVRLDLENDANVAGPPGARIGFIVNKSVGSAVQRNRVRRRLRHCLQPSLGDLPAGALVVVRALPAAASSSAPELAADVESCLRRAMAKAERAVSP